MALTSKNTSTLLQHGPDHAEHELRKAYNCIIEAGVTYASQKERVPEVQPQEALQAYENAFQLYQDGKRLAAERWARAAKHLARAFWHEAKIAYLEPQLEKIPYLTGAQDEEYHLHERVDATTDLLASLQALIPQGLRTQPPLIQRYLGRAQFHLHQIPRSKHELLRAERIKAAYEYSRVVECMNLGYEAQTSTQKGAAA